MGAAAGSSPQQPEVGVGQLGRLQTGGLVKLPSQLPGLVA